MEDINRNSRIVLIARGFDPALFSMGEWLSDSSVAFRCIEYMPFQVGDEQFISFSVKFDRTPTSLYPLLFGNQMRAPAYFWHNIGHASNDWWNFLKKNGVISAGFDNQPGDQGERILQSYTPGDTIIAYAKGFGAVGWGTIGESSRYYLVAEGSKDDVRKGHHLHRRGINWTAVAPTLEQGLRPNVVRDKFGIYHPVATWSSIADEKAKRLVEALKDKFSKT